VLRTRAEAIRVADPLQRPVFAHKGSPVIGSGQDWTYARCQDFLGSSCYPAWGSGHRWDDRHLDWTGHFDRHAALLMEMWDGVALRFDYIRSCNRRGAPVWAAEFQGGPVSTGFHKGRMPSPADIRRWMLTAVGSGVTAISFWVARAEIMAAEANGFSLLDSAGDSTPRYEEAARIGQALNRHADLFARPTWGGAEAAILVNEDAYQLCSILADGHEHLPYSLRGWHRLLWEASIPVDFLNVSNQEEYGSTYRVVVLPFPLSLSEEVASRLARYVERGGHLICEASPGRIDEHACCNRGELSPTMADLLGVQQESFTMVREPEGGERWSPRERTWGEYLEAAELEGVGPLAGLCLRASGYIETYRPEEATPCLRYGEQVAGVVRPVGKGQAWLLGTYVGHSGTAYRHEDVQAFVRGLLAQCGVRPNHEGRLLLRKRAMEGKEAWIYTNPHEEAVSEEIDVRGWAQVEDLLGEPLLRMGDTIHLQVAGLDVRALILQRQEK
jgi:hypothetical protein